MTVPNRQHPDNTMRSATLLSELDIAALHLDYKESKKTDEHGNPNPATEPLKEQTPINVEVGNACNPDKKRRYKIEMRVCALKLSLCPAGVIQTFILYSSPAEFKRIC
jgi:hypothetical protein